MPPRIQPLISEDLMDCTPVDVGEGIVVDQISASLGAAVVSVAIDGTFSKKTLICKAPATMIKQHISRHWGRVVKASDNYAYFDGVPSYIMLKRKGKNTFMLVSQDLVRPDVLATFNAEVL